MACHNASYINALHIYAHTSATIIYIHDRLCMYTCAHTCIHSYIHTHYIHTSIQTCINPILLHHMALHNACCIMLVELVQSMCTHTLIHNYIYTCMHVTHTCIHTYIHTYDITCTHACMCTCMNKIICACIGVYINNVNDTADTHKHIHTFTQPLIHVLHACICAYAHTCIHTHVCTFRALKGLSTHMHTNIHAYIH